MRILNRDLNAWFWGIVEIAPPCRIDDGVCKNVFIFFLSYGTVTTRNVWFLANLAAKSLHHFSFKSGREISSSDDCSRSSMLRFQPVHSFVSKWTWRRWEFRQSRLTKAAQNVSNSSCQHFGRTSAVCRMWSTPPGMKETVATVEEPSVKACITFNNERQPR